MNITTDLIFHDSKGRLCLLQAPNPPLIAWAVCLVLQRILSVANQDNGQFYQIVGVIGFGSLFIWCWLEIFQGSCYARRALGLVILVMIVLNKV